MANIKPNAGDYIVFKYSYGYDIRGPVGKLTENSAYVPSYAGKQRRVSFEDIVFTGDQQEATLLSERLISSKARLHDEERSARERHTQRDNKLIFEAIEGAAIPSHERQSEVQS